MLPVLGRGWGSHANMQRDCMLYGLFVE